jgi:hypothetical protein
VRITHGYVRASSKSARGTHKSAPRKAAPRRPATRAKKRR